jgi:hypothetical protein
MDGDSGAINKVETALGDAASGNITGAGSELSAAGHDILTSLESLLGRTATDAEKLAVLGIETLKTDLATPLGQAAVSAIGTAIADAAAGQSVSQIGAAVLPTLETAVVSDAKAAGQDVENVVLNTTRVMLLGSQAQTGNATSDTSAASPITTTTTSVSG